MKLILLFLLLWSRMAACFTLNSTNNSNFKGWADYNIKFQLNTTNCPSGVDVAGIINASLDIWNNVATSKVHLSVVETTTSTTHSYPITIYCETNYGSVVGSADGSPGAASALPTTGDYFSSGLIYLNASSGLANISRINPAVLSIVLAHEIGHAIGFGHSQDTNALMYYSASQRTTLGLAQDDMDAVSYLYPRNEFGEDRVLGCGRVNSTGSGPSSGQLGLVFILLLFPILLVQRFRHSMKSRITYHG